MQGRAFLESLPKKRMAAGALLFDTAGRLLIVKPVYKDGWTIPGGTVELNESPHHACIREVYEELHLRCKLQRLLCIDYVSDTVERTEGILFIFDGSVLTAEAIATITLPPAELCAFQFLEPQAVLPLLDERLARRVARCLEVIGTERTLYLEDQQVVCL